MSDRVTESIRMFRSWKVWGGYAALLAVAIPWYWRLLPGGGDWFWLGLPIWAVVSVAGSVGISSLTAWLLQCRWPGEEDAESDDDADLGGRGDISGARRDEEAAT